MVNDEVAEKLEARGLWRRAAARWLEVMTERYLSDIQLEWISRRRYYCLSMISSPRPDNKMDVVSVLRAVTQMQKQMGIIVPTKIHVSGKSFEHK